MIESFIPEDMMKSEVVTVTDTHTNRPPTSRHNVLLHRQQKIVFEKAWKKKRWYRPPLESRE